MVRPSQNLPGLGLAQAKPIKGHHLNTPILKESAERLPQETPLAKRQVLI